MDPWLRPTRSNHPLEPAPARESSQMPWCYGTVRRLLRSRTRMEATPQASTIAAQTPISTLAAPGIPPALLGAMLPPTAVVVVVDLPLRTVVVVATVVVVVGALATLKVPLKVIVKLPLDSLALVVSVAPLKLR